MLSIYNVMSMIISLNKAAVKKIFKPDQQQLISIKILNEWVDILRAFLWFKLRSKDEEGALITKLN